MHGIPASEIGTRAVKRPFFFLFILATTLSAQVDVLTANYDNNRTNANLSEFVLNKSNVNPAHFGKLYAFSIDGEAYAQPLYLRGVNIGGATHNVLYAATMHNSVYAFDADAAGSTAPLWKVNFGTPVNPHDFDIPADPTANPPSAALPYTDILTEIGILGTPVIDPDTGALYVVHYSYTGSGAAKGYAYYLHALDLATGAEKIRRTRAHPRRRHRIRMGGPRDCPEQSTRFRRGPALAASGFAAALRNHLHRIRIPRRHRSLARLADGVRRGDAETDIHLQHQCR